MVLSSGCLATQDWVQSWTKEQLFPVEKRVSETEAGLTKVNGRVSGLESQVQNMSGQIANLDRRIKQTDAKADRALETLQKLKVERKLVLHMKQGGFLANNSTVLSGQAKTEIDSFLSDVSGQAGRGSHSEIMVTPCLRAASRNQVSRSPRVAANAGEVFHAAILTESGPAGL